MKTVSSIALMLAILPGTGLAETSAITGTCTSITSDLQGPEHYQLNGDRLEVRYLKSCAEALSLLAEFTAETEGAWLTITLVEENDGTYTIHFRE
ncbi:MAG TPA: hypothetical protein VKP88_04680 [Candidatus Paceibacterota bacterium]|nr:hypothetical protein [Candidatus Paceibacterota bacterium]